MTEKSVSIDLPTDDAGILPRQCPNCSGKFGVHGDTYEQEHYLNLRCPYCEWIGEFDEFLTEEQAQYAEAVAETELRRMAEQEFAEQWENAFDGMSSNDFLEIETNTDEIDFGDRSSPSPQLSIDTDSTTCQQCGFPYIVQSGEADVSCPVCR